MDISFKYLQNTPENTSIKGLFVFTLYIKKKKLEENVGSFIFKRSPAESPYVQGIQSYLDGITRKDTVFKDWKILIYTDIPTYELLEEEEVLVNNTHVDFCIIKWPYYTPVEGGHINGDVLRCLRFRAMFDFSTIPVFIRDADTLFVTDLFSKSKMCYRKLLKDECKDILYEWEKSFYQGAQKHPNTWIFGTSLAYKKNWHKNEKRGLFAPMGAFAGLQSIMPKVTCFQDTSLWTKAIQYIMEDSKRIEGEEQVIKKNGMEFYMNGEVTYSNNDTLGKIGKDERILLYIFFPNCNPENIFFFDLNYGNKRAYTFKGKTYSNSNFPSIIFSRGSNTNVQQLFMNAVKANQPFKVNTNERRKQLLNQNKNRLTQKINTLDAMVKVLKNKEKEFNESFDISLAMESIYNVLQEMGYKDELTPYFTQFQKEKKTSDELQKDFHDTMIYVNSEEEIKSKLTTLDNALYAKNKAMDEFLEKSLSLKSKEEIINAIPMFQKPKIKQFLNIFTSTKKGGRRTRKRRKNH